jgi:RimJ/RimL family protein N-acetyltransferase
MAQAPVQVRLRPFDRSDFEHLISWVPTSHALSRWCGAFFSHPLNEHQLQRYLDSATQPLVRTIFTATSLSGEAVGHISVAMIWPHLSSRLSRVLVAPSHRGRGIGRIMVANATAFSFETYHVDRIDLGVAADNAVAIACYHGQGFSHIGTWPKAIPIEAEIIDVCWMTLTRTTFMAEVAARPDLEKGGNRPPRFLRSKRTPLSVCLGHSADDPLTRSARPLPAET